MSIRLMTTGWIEITIPPELLCILSLVSVSQGQALKINAEFFLKSFWSPFCWATDTPVLDF